MKTPIAHSPTLYGLLVDTLVQHANAVHPNPDIIWLTHYPVHVNTLHEQIAVSEQCYPDTVIPVSQHPPLHCRLHGLQPHTIETYRQNLPVFNPHYFHRIGNISAELCSYYPEQPHHRTRFDCPPRQPIGRPPANRDPDIGPWLRFRPLRLHAGRRRLPIRDADQIIHLLHSAETPLDADGPTA